MQYPLIYKTIPTQYCFFLKEEDGKYIVQVSQTTPVEDKVFNSLKEAEEFINIKEIL